MPNLHPIQTYRIGHSGGCQVSQGILVQIPFKKSLHGCRLDFPDGLLPLRLLFLNALPPLCVGGSEDGTVFGVGFCTVLFQHHADPCDS